MIEESHILARGYQQDLHVLGAGLKGLQNFEVDIHFVDIEGNIDYKISNGGTDVH